MDPLDPTPRPFDLHEILTTDSEETLAQARELVLEYGRFVVSQPGAARFCFGTLEKEAEGLPLSYHAQGGGCFIAHVHGQPAGFIAWREVPEAVASNAWELKRLWVRPAARGLSLGRALTLAVLERAIAAGRTAIYLDTAPASMAAAYRMYLDLGFETCAPYNNNPVEGLAYLRRKL